MKLAQLNESFTVTTLNNFYAVQELSAGSAWFFGLNEPQWRLWFGEGPLWSSNTEYQLMVGNGRSYPRSRSHIAVVGLLEAMTGVWRPI